MRQLVILIISVIILVFSGIWEINYIKDTSMYALSDVEYSKNAVINGNFKLAKTQVDELEHTWDSMKDVWNIFIEHHEIDTIESTMVEYKSYIESENKEEALVIADSLVRTFYHISKKQQINSGNIF